MATVVTCYYKIPSKHSYNHYTAWIKNFMSLPMKVILFVDDESENILKERYPANKDRIYINLPITQFYTNRFNWKKDEMMDSAIGIGRNQLLYKIWNEKPFFMLYASQLNPFQTDMFMWVDIGCFRDSSRLDEFLHFPNSSKMNREKVTFLLLDQFLNEHFQHLDRIDDRFNKCVTVGGTMFCCPKSMIQWFAKTHAGILKEFEDADVFKGDDQHKYAYSICRFPDKYMLITPPESYRYDKWFYLHDYFA